jgi:hypothetical protein
MTSRTEAVVVDGVGSEAKEFTYTYDLDRLIQIVEKVDGVTTNTQVLDFDGAGNASSKMPTILDIFSQKMTPLHPRIQF